MKRFRDNFTSFCAIAMIALFAGFSNSCSNDDMMRTPDDIMGIWMSEDQENVYLEFSDNNEVHYLKLDYDDNETIGLWELDVYIYEPGYNLVIYINHNNEAMVYKIISLDSRYLTWCKVKDIDPETVSRENIGQLIGQILNEAQEGFTTYPELYQTFKRIPENEYLEMLERLDIFYPW